MFDALSEAGQTMNSPAPARKLSPSRIMIVCLAVLLGVLLLGQARLVLQRDGAFYRGGDVPVGNDFLVFYTAGRIVAEGDGHRLYDPARQHLEQGEILGRDRGLAIFPYPAFVTIPYAAVARLPFVTAWVVVTLFMAAATAATVAMLRTVSPSVRERPFVCGLAVLASQPLLAATLGGQTVAMSLLAMTGVYVSLRREREVAAGLWFGVLLYKPQLAVVLLLVLLWRRRWRTMVTAAGVGVGLTLLGVLAAGPSWPRDFLQLSTSPYYRDNAATVDGLSSISLPGIAQWLNRSGSNAPWIFAVVAAGCLTVLAITIGVWRDGKPTDPRFPLRFGLAITATLLVSPHALFYEAALLVLPIIMLIDHWRGAAAGSSLRNLTLWQQRMLIGLFLLGSARPLTAMIGVQPLALLPIAAAALLLWELSPWARHGPHRRLTVMTPAASRAETARS